MIWNRKTQRTKIARRLSSELEFPSLRHRSIFSDAAFLKRATCGSFQGNTEQGQEGELNLIVSSSRFNAEEAR
jgi:hypothetical protein